MNEKTIVSVDDVNFIKDLYPRLEEDDANIERCRAAIDKIPPIVVARDSNVLVDGYHRWQAHRREKLDEIEAINLGDLTDIEIIKESLKRNASHGQQLSAKDKKKNAERLYRDLAGDPKERYQEISELLSITLATAKKYCAEARRDEKEAQQEKAWDLWLDCWAQEAIADEVGVNQATVSRWIMQNRTNSELHNAPESRQHFDVWNFHKADDDAGTESFFGRMPSQVVENLLWLYTDIGDIVFDPFVGGGTTIDVAKRMARRVWASDLTPSTPMKPIHEHDILEGWPEDAPNKVDFILLDPPYWQQAKGKYSDSKKDLGNMSLEKYMESWESIVSTCKGHLAKNGKLAFIISPSIDGDRVIGHAFQMYQVCVEIGLEYVRRIIVPYSTEQADGQDVEWAREGKRLLKLYRDLVVFQDGE